MISQDTKVSNIRSNFSFNCMGDSDMCHGLNVFVLSKFTYWNSNPSMRQYQNMRVSGKWSGHECGDSVNGISALIKCLFMKHLLNAYHWTTLGLALAGVKWKDVHLSSKGLEWHTVSPHKIMNTFGGFMTGGVGRQRREPEGGGCGAGEVWEEVGLLGTSSCHCPEGTTGRKGGNQWNTVFRHLPSSRTLLPQNQVFTCLPLSDLLVCSSGCISRQYYLKGRLTP